MNIIKLLVIMTIINKKYNNDKTIFYYPFFFRPLRVQNLYKNEIKINYYYSIFVF